MIRRTLLLVAVALVAFAGPAGAQEYDGTSGSATVTEEEIIVQADGFESNTEVSYSVDYTPEGDESAAASLEAAGVMFARSAPAVPTEVVETGTTMSDGGGAVEFAVDNRGDGYYEITITDGTNTEVVGVTVGDGTSPAATPTETDNLALTGSDSSIGLAQGAVVLVVLGAVAVYIAKRRRSTVFSD